MQITGSDEMKNTEKEIDEFLAIFSQCYKECFGNGKI